MMSDQKNAIMSAVKKRGYLEEITTKEFVIKYVFTLLDIGQWLSKDVWDIAASYIEVSGYRNPHWRIPSDQAIRKGYMYGLSIFGIPYGVWRRFVKCKRFHLNYWDCGHRHECARAFYDVLINYAPMNMYADPAENPLVYNTYKSEINPVSARHLYIYYKFRNSAGDQGIEIGYVNRCYYNNFKNLRKFQATTRVVKIT